MTYLSKTDTWPPTQKDRNRLEKYKENKELFEGSHDEAFKDVQDKLNSNDVQAMTYLVMNYCGLLSKLSADMLFGESPEISGEEDAVDDRLKELMNQNNFFTNLYETALGSSYRGDACLKVRYGKRSKFKDDREVLIVPQNPNYYFVEHAPEDIREIERKVIGWKFKMDTTGNDVKDTKYLKIAVHEPNRIYNYLYEMNGQTVGKQVSLDTNNIAPNLEEEQETGIDDFLIVHIPNWRSDERYWGYSDYLDIKSLQDEANNRLSQISRVLDMHADPKMRGPAEAMDDEGRVPVTGSKYFPYERDGVKPEYITWSAKLESAFKQVDEILDAMFLVTETSPDAFGLEGSNLAESGRALKYRLMRLVSKIGRKRIYYDRGIKDILHLAQLMDVRHNGGNYEPEVPSISWRDGLPDDFKEKSTITESLDRSDAISVEEKVRYNHPDWEEEKIQSEIGRIEAEIEEERTAGGPAL